MIKKMSRKSTIVVVTLITFFAISVTAFAAGKWVQAWQDDTLKIKFDGSAQSFTDPDDGSKIVPLVFNGRTYLPVRAIAGLAGLGVDYDSVTRSVLLTNEKSTPVDSNTPNVSNSIDSLKVGDMVFIKPDEEFRKKRMVIVEPGVTLDSSDSSTTAISREEWDAKHYEEKFNGLPIKVKNIKVSSTKVEIWGDEYSLQDIILSMNINSATNTADIVYKPSVKQLESSVLNNIISIDNDTKYYVFKR